VLRDARTSTVHDGRGLFAAVSQGDPDADASTLLDWA